MAAGVSETETKLVIEDGRKSCLVSSKAEKNRVFLFLTAGYFKKNSAATDESNPQQKQCHCLHSIDQSGIRSHDLTVEESTWRQCATSISFLSLRIFHFLLKILDTERQTVFSSA